MAMFQIYEEDLVELERIVPQISDTLEIHFTPKIRTQMRRVRDILSKVRWNYGPHTDVEVIPAE